MLQQRNVTTIHVDCFQTGLRAFVALIYFKYKAVCPLGGIKVARRPGFIALGKQTCRYRLALTREHRTNLKIFWFFACRLFQACQAGIQLALGNELLTLDKCLILLRTQ